MKFSVEIEIPDELEGAVKQTLFKLNLTYDQLASQAVTHAMERVLSGMKLEGSLIASLAGDAEELRAINDRKQLDLLVLEKTIAAVNALTKTITAQFGIETNK